jgi:hypothetical protein
MDGLLILVIIVLVIIVFVMVGTNRRLEKVNSNMGALNDNITDNQEKMLEIQKDLLSCLEKMSKSPDADAPKKINSYPL